MEKQIQPFKPKIFTHEQFGKLRVVIIDNAVWFVAVDVARALEYQNPQRAIRAYVDPQDKRIEEVVTGGGNQKTMLINKSGVYSLVLDSNMPKAKEFRRRVTADVLIQIDEEGCYVKPDRKPPSELACVYAFAMSNDTAKIGITANVEDRTKRIQRKTKLQVREDARRMYAALRVDGEFFRVEFPEVKRELERLGGAQRPADSRDRQPLNRAEYFLSFACADD